jgi:hypothetical protein
MNKLQMLERSITIREAEWVDLSEKDNASQYIEGITDKGEITLPKPKPPGYTRRTTRVYS